MKNNKTPGNDGLTKEFYKTVWDELKTPLIESFNQTLHTKIYQHFRKTSFHQAHWEKRPRYTKYEKLKTNSFFKYWHKNFFYFKKIKNCFAYVNFFRTNCLCKKQVYWKKWYNNFWHKWNQISNWLKGEHKKFWRCYFLFLPLKMMGKYT